MESEEMSLAKNLEVPSFEKEEFSKKYSKYALVVFVINEGERIKKQMGEMKFFADKVDIIIADGGSTDDSLNRKVLTENNVRTLLTKTGPGKLSAQMRMAFYYTLEQGYAGTIVIDGNDKDDVAAVSDFVSYLDKGYDFIQGSRFIKGGKAINTPLIRLFGLRLLHAPLISFAARHWYTDTTNGFRAYSKKLLEDKKINIFREVFSKYELHYYLSIESARRGYRVIEIPVTRRYPRTGKTPTKISPLTGNLIILRTLFNSILGRYKPRSLQK